MRLEGNPQVIVLEMKNCPACESGTTPKRKWRECPKCKGTGRRGSGRCRECNSKDRYYLPGDSRPGYVWYYDHDDRVACTSCGGSYQEAVPESYTDNVPPAILAELPIEVVGNGQRVMGWVEQHLGAGIYTIVDYGRHKSKTAAELVEEIHDEIATGKTRIQACKVVRSKDDLTLCSGFAIILGDQGFSVIPHFD